MHMEEDGKTHQTRCQLTGCRGKTHATDVYKKINTTRNSTGNIRYVLIMYDSIVIANVKLSV